MNPRQDITLLDKIQAIAQVNKEIISRIEEVQGGGNSFFNYELSGNPLNLLDITEKRTSVNLCVLPFRPVLKPVEDTFNDKICFECQTFEDVVNLNNNMLPVARKYKKFGGSAEAVEDLRLFLHNYEVLQTLLGGIEERIQIMTESYLQPLQEEVQEINNQITNLRKKIKDLNTKIQLQIPQRQLNKLEIHKVYKLKFNNNILTKEFSEFGCAYGDPLPMDGEQYSLTFKFIEVPVDKIVNVCVGLSNTNMHQSNALNANSNPYIIIERATVGEQIQVVYDSKAHVMTVNHQSMAFEKLHVYPCIDMPHQFSSRTSLKLL